MKKIISILFAASLAASCQKEISKHETAPANLSGVRSSTIKLYHDNVNLFGYCSFVVGRRNPVDVYDANSPISFGGFTILNKSIREADAIDSLKIDIIPYAGMRSLILENIGTTSFLRLNGVTVTLTNAHYNFISSGLDESLYLIYRK